MAFNRTTSTVTRFARRLLGLLAVALLLLGGGHCLFGGSNDCDLGQIRCNNGGIERCEEPRCSEPGCPGREWQLFQYCKYTFCVVVDGEPECVNSPVVDPACKGPSHCADGGIISCVGGYPVGIRYDCGPAGCVESNGTAKCAPSLEPCDGGAACDGALDARNADR